MPLKDQKQLDITLCYVQIDPIQFVLECLSFTQCCQNISFNNELHNEYNALCNYMRKHAILQHDIEIDQANYPKF